MSRKTAKTPSRASRRPSQSTRAMARSRVSVAKPVPTVPTPFRFATDKRRISRMPAPLFDLTSLTVVRSRRAEAPLRDITASRAVQARCESLSSVLDRCDGALGRGRTDGLALGDA